MHKLVMLVASEAWHMNAGDWLLYWWKQPLLAFSMLNQDPCTYGTSQLRDAKHCASYLCELNASH
jgi:hypothetical protein